MAKIIHHTKPLAIRDGLNPTRARVDAPISAWDFVSTIIATQRHRHPLDNDAALQQRFDEGEVVDGKGTPLSPDSPLKPGTDVWFYRMPAPETPVPYELETIFEDEHILVVDKPPFLATMPRARHITETATTRLRRATGIMELTPAHRLDRPTAGVLLFTKHPEVRGAYQNLFARREVKKVYEAIADYREFSTPVMWENRIQKVPGELQAYYEEGEPNAITTLASIRPVSDEKQAALESVHGELPRQAIYELHPATGRTHQLRMHMWSAGVPILGDMIYPECLPLEAEDFRVPMHLLARSISFTDPLSEQVREFKSLRD